MHQHSAHVTVHDPHANPAALLRHPELDYADTLSEASKQADAIVIGTEWPQFREADPIALRSSVANPLVIDLRNVLEADRWRQAGWTVHQLGRPQPTE
jgi:UDPglucose 6-dehydrogenase